MKAIKCQIISFCVINKREIFPCNFNGLHTNFRQYTVKSTVSITRIFNEQYPLQIHSLIANYYFNHLDANINNTWISLHEAVQQAKINKSN